MSKHIDESHLHEEYYNYEVEKILKWQWNKQSQTNQYYIKWLGYSSQHNDWVDEADLNCDKLVEEFNQRDRGKFAREVKIKKRLVDQTLVPDSQEKEEPDDTDFILDMDLIPFKIVKKNEENGFDRGWQAEKVLLLVCSSSGIRKPDSAIVKFKGFKYSQLISLEQLKQCAPRALSEYLSNRLKLQLTKKYSCSYP